MISKPYHLKVVIFLSPVQAAQHAWALKEGTSLAPGTCCSFCVSLGWGGKVGLMLGYIWVIWCHEGVIWGHLKVLWSGMCSYRVMCGYLCYVGFCRVIWDRLVVLWW